MLLLLLEVLSNLLYFFLLLVLPLFAESVRLMNMLGIYAISHLHVVIDLVESIPPIFSLCPIATQLLKLGGRVRVCLFALIANLFKVILILGQRTFTVLCILFRLLYLRLVVEITVRCHTAEQILTILHMQARLYRPPPIHVIVLLHFCFGQILT